MTYLIDSEHVGGSISTPFSRHSIIFVQPFFNDFTRSVACKEAVERARTRSTVKPYGQSISWLVASYESEEEVGRIILRNIHPAGILLVRIECCTTSHLRFLIRYCHIFIGRRTYHGQIEILGIVYEELPGGRNEESSREKELRKEHDESFYYDELSISRPSLYVTSLGSHLNDVASNGEV